MGGGILRVTVVQSYMSGKIMLSMAVPIQLCSYW